MGYVFPCELMEYELRVSTPKARVDTKEISLCKYNPHEDMQLMFSSELFMRSQLPTHQTHKKEQRLFHVVHTLWLTIKISSEIIKGF